MAPFVPSVNHLYCNEGSFYEKKFGPTLSWGHQMYYITVRLAKSAISAPTLLLIHQMDLRNGEFDTNGGVYGPLPFTATL